MLISWCLILTSKAELIFDLILCKELITCVYLLVNKNWLGIEEGWWFHTSFKSCLWSLLAVRNNYYSEIWLFIVIHHIIADILKDLKVFWGLNIVTDKPLFCLHRFPNQIFHVDLVFNFTHSYQWKLGLV